MKVWVITLEFAFEGEIIEEIYKKKKNAQKRIDYLNKHNTVSTQKYLMKDFKIKDIENKFSRGENNG